MANHKSAIKRARQNTKLKNHNKARRTELRTIIKGLRKAISAKKKDEATNLLHKVQSLSAKLAKTNILKPNTTSRLTSRLTIQVNRL